MRAIYDNLQSSKLFHPLKDVLLFAVLLFGFHFLYLLWARVGFYPVGEMVDSLFRWSAHLLFVNTKVFLDVIGFEVDAQEPTFYFFKQEGGNSWITISTSCASLKAWMQWIFLMLLFPGPWKHKAWYIPLGILVIQIVSTIRILILIFVLDFRPEYFDVFHEDVVRFIFYGTIFLMWVLWVERFRSGGGKKLAGMETTLASQLNNNNEAN